MATVKEAVGLRGSGCGYQRTTGTAPVAQSVEHLALGFGSGHDLMGWGIECCVGLLTSVGCLLEKFTSSARVYSCMLSQNR